MKFLFKLFFLVVACTSNFALGITAKEILENANDMKQALLKIENQFEQATNIIGLERLRHQAKVAENINEIIDSHDCNCTKLNLLDNSELKIAQFLLWQRGYTTPKTEKRIQEEVEDFIELFPELASDKEKYTETIKERNEQMKCMQKILRTINKIKNQNKVE